MVSSHCRWSAAIYCSQPGRRGHQRQSSPCTTWFVLEFIISFSVYLNVCPSKLPLYILGPFIHSFVIKLRGRNSNSSCLISKNSVHSHVDVMLMYKLPFETLPLRKLMPQFLCFVFNAISSCIQLLGKILFVVLMMYMQYVSLSLRLRKFISYLT